MPVVRLSMRKIRDVLRLKFEGGQTNRRIARSCHISRPSVAHYLLRFQEAGLEGSRHVQTLPQCDARDKTWPH
jgi:hypothetical protein